MLVFSRMINVFHISGLVASTKPPSILSMVTWNIDGLDDKNLKKRTAHVIHIMKKIKPDVILLQEATAQIVEVKRPRQ